MFFGEGGQVGKTPGQRRRVERFDQRADFRPRGEAGAQSREIARRSVAERDPRDDTLDVADLAQGRAEPLGAAGIDQGEHGALPFAHGVGVSERRREPALQQPRAHGRARLVQHAVNSAPGCGLAVEAGVDFEVAAGALIEDHMVLGLEAAHRDDVVEGLPARVLRVAQHRAGGADARGHFVYAETRQVAHAEVLGQEPFGEIEIEVEGGTARDLAARVDGHIFRRHQFRGADSVQLRDQRICRIAFADMELSGGDIEPTQSPAVPVGMHARQHALAVGIQQPVLGQRSRRHDARHAALHGSLRRRRIADLFADRDGASHPREPRQVAVHAVEGHAGHGDGLSRRTSAGGERDVEQVRRLAGVVEEQLVEVAHAVEQQDVRELGLDAEVLPHHRGVRGGVHSFPDVMRVPHSRSLRLRLWPGPARRPWKATRIRHVEFDWTATGFPDQEKRAAREGPIVSQG